MDTAVAKRLLIHLRQLQKILLNVLQTMPASCKLMTGQHLLRRHFLCNAKLGFQTHFCRGFYQRWILAGARSSFKKSECRGATRETRTCSTHHHYDQLCKQDATASSATAKSLAGCSGQNRNDKRRWYYNGIASPHSLHFGNKHPPWTIAVASHSVSFRVKRSR